ncbi:hypothetical protein FZEAL_2995 [Fusarium zealandicum]|uniref:Protein kinase domain-containing protein n=1 Tax=Fusarium zealandicum TaxID=1053134 RepID=A0A8H4UQG1_9HYPO|nr:hypothetical protein FZEAL_2995 [Fusarium zealandicum]
MSSHPLVDFREYLQRLRTSGVNGYGKEAPYVPHSSLKEYWTEKRIQEILDSCNPFIPASASQILTKFLRIFSLLVYLDRPGDISLFTRKNIDDSQLPLADLPTSWPHELITKISESQWRFCPLEFTSDHIHKRELPAQQVLPITYETPLRVEGQGPDAARIWKVQIHTSCNNIVPANEPVVFKIYEGGGSKELYNAEADVYALLSRKHEDSITKFYGSFSFEETQKRIIILEYASGGSLHDFFERNQPPVVPEDLELLWNRLLELLDGLHILHNLDKPQACPEWFISGRVCPVTLMTGLAITVHRVHQDIQPANILVFPQSDKSPFDVRFKLTDFGIAEMRRVLIARGAMATENAGNRMYSAPETYPNFRVQSNVKARTDPSVDVWALGAVYSDVLVWSISGEAGREQHRSRRQSAIRELKYISNRDFDACFHDGKNRLPIVDDYHKEVLQHKRASDTMSLAMNQLILEFMLVDRETRLFAMQVKMQAKRKMKMDQDGRPMDPSLPPRPIPSTRQTVPLPSLPAPIDTQPGPHPGPLPRGHSRGSFLPPPESDTGVNFPSFGVLRESPTNETQPEPGPPTVTRNPTTTSTPPPKPVIVKDVYELLLKKNSSARSIWDVWDKSQDKQSEVMQLRGMQEARSNISTLRGREQIMLIDNFASMSPHMDNVAKTARVIGYVAKTADNDGMDLYFASDTTKSRTCKSSTAVEAAIRKAKAVEGSCNMQRCLVDILEPVWKKLERGMSASIYVYTDGVWEPGEDQVKSVIKEAIRRLSKAHKPAITLMFQFIQFGEDAKGTERLEYLDDMCKEEHSGGKYDIVDSKRWDEHVPSIVIGSISGANDSRIFGTPKQLGG